MTTRSGCQFKVESTGKEGLMAEGVQELLKVLLDERRRREEEVAVEREERRKREEELAKERKRRDEEREAEK